MFTIAEFQLNFAFPEGKLGRGRKTMGLFMKEERGDLVTEVRTEKVQYYGHFGSCILSFVFVSVRKMKLRD